MRLIDADELKKALAEMWYESAIRITALSVAELIDNAPTIEPNCQQCAIKELWKATEKEDLVAVVRCKDCIHRIDRRSDLGHFMCEMFYGQGDVSDENFCQWGERKTNAID